MYVLLPLYIEQRLPFIAINMDLSVKRLARRVAMPTVNKLATVCHPDRPKHRLMVPQRRSPYRRTY
jgi:hypothetical protein